MLSRRMTGRIVRIPGNDVSTDVIAPTFWVHRGRGEHDLATLRPHAFESLRPGLDEHMRPGDIVVAGRNFGAGSHREEAVRILQVWGVQAIIAESAARIYFRNAIAAGLPLIQVENALELFDDGDEAEIDIDAWTVVNRRTGARRTVQPYPPTILRILEAGGIAPLVRDRGLAAGDGTRAMPVRY
ncbi:LeuD/DmdB family oxidoreductase small subunit [Micromonospora sp. NPDC005161]